MATAKNLPCNTPGIRAHITIITHDDNIVVRGYAVDENTLIRIDDSKLHQHTVQKESEVPHATTYVVAAIDTEQHKSRTKSIASTHRTNADTYYSNIFSNCPDLSSMGKPEWGGTTHAQSTNYLIHSLLPRMDKYGPDICAEDIDNIKKDLVSRAVENKRGQRSLDVAKKSVHNELSRAVYIYNNVCEQHPDYDLPDIDFSLVRPSKVGSLEQFKSLPDDIRIKFAYLINKLAASGVGLALGAGMMFYCSLRTGEAVAPMIGDFAVNDKYATYPVTHRMAGDLRTDILKTIAAYRVVVLPKAMTDMISEHIKMLIDSNIPMDDVLSAPLVTQELSPTEYCDERILSAFCKELLIACGCTAEYMRGAMSLQHIEPDLGAGDDGGYNTDITAYILRRDGCSRACNICGLDADIVDYLIGHANERNRKKDYLTPEAQSAIARALELYVPLPKHSAHPGYSQVPLISGTNITIDGSNCYDFVANEPIVLLLHITTVEPNEIFSIVSNGDIVTAPTATSSPYSTRKQSRPPIGIFRERDYYNRIIAEADQIDISNLINKYK